MADFVKGGGISEPFGRNEFLRSTNPKPRTESYTCARLSVPARTIDGNPNQRILQPGTAMAKITSGPDAGKIGPYQAGATDGRGTLANLVGLELTFLPWTLTERDVEVSVCYDTTVAVQAWCIEYAADGTPVPLSNAVADALRGGKRGDINFV